MSAEWQLRRSELNHQWLKNEFTRHLRAFVTRLLTPEADERRIAEFAREDWPKFAAKREQIIDLLGSAEEALSPQRVFDQPPISRCPPETCAWLSRVVHSLWLARTPVRQQIHEAETELDSANLRYAELDLLVRNVDFERLRSAVDSFVAFEEDVKRLSACLSRLPRGVQVV